MATYEEFQQKSVSEKMGLATVEAARRLSGWALDSGAIYSIPFEDSSVVTEIADDGVVLTSVGSKGAITPGDYFFDRVNNEIFLETADSTDPGLGFISCEFRLFFAEGPTIAPNDLASGFDVEWLPLLKPLSSYGVKLDNRDQIGLAIEGSGGLSFFNDLDYWRPRYDKLFFENKRVFIYSWSHGIPITEAKLIYRGRIQTKAYSDTSVSFRLKDFINELRSPPTLSAIGDISGALIPDSLLEARQRRIYGYVFGYRPTNIDQVLDGYSLSGTVSTTTASATLTGVGTTFFNDFSPGDQIIIDGAEDEVTVESVTSDTVLVMTEEFDASAITGATYKVLPELPKRYTNRNHFVSGDTLGEPSTTVTSVNNSLIFDVADVSSLRAGDPVIINSEERTILRISDNTVRLTVALSTAPSVSDTVTRPSFSNVRIDNTLLVRTRDFTVPGTNDRIILDELAEFNNAKLETLTPGTLSFASSDTVTGTGTTFTSSVKPGDWLRLRGEADYFEVLQIGSDTTLKLRVAATYTGSGTGDIRRPNYYEEGTSFLTCDAIGLTEDGTKTGDLLITGPSIVKDMLKQGGIDASDINDSTFDNSDDIAQYRMGLAIPSNFSDTATPKTRDSINQINESIIGALVQNEDFKFDYLVIGPGRSVSDISIDETEALSFSITSDSNRIVKDTIIQYGFKEHDPLSAGSSFLCETATSKTASYLAKSTRTVTKNTLLVDQRDANIISERLGFIREVSSSVVKFKTKLQTSRLQVTDIIKFSHPKLYERFGSTDSNKIAAIQALSKSSSGVSVELEDLGNAFTRCPSIALDTSVDYSTALEDEKIVNGYITEEDGTVDDPSQSGINVIY